MAFLSTIFKGTAIAVVVVGIGGGVKSCVMDENPDNASAAKKFTKGVLSTYGDIGSEVIAVFKDPKTHKDIEEGTESTLDAAGQTLNSILGGAANFMRKEADKMEEEKRLEQERTQNSDNRDTIKPAGDLPGIEY